MRFDDPRVVGRRVKFAIGDGEDQESLDIVHQGVVASNRAKGPFGGGPFIIVHPDAPVRIFRRTYPSLARSRRYRFSLWSLVTLPEIRTMTVNVYDAERLDSGTELLARAMLRWSRD